MAKVRSPRCPGCGAALPLRDATPWVRCTYCGREVEIARTQQLAAVPAAERSSPRALVAWFVGLGVVAVIVAGVVAVLRARPASRVVTSTPVDAAVPPPPLVDARAPGLHAWVGSGNLPVLADVDGDGVEDVIGRFSELEPEHTVWLGAFSGADLSPLWRAGPFAAWPGEVRFAGAGERLVVADPSPALHVLDRATGEHRATATLSDKVRHVCVLPGDEVAFLELVDEQHVSVTVATGAVERTPRPGACPPPPRPYCASGLHHAPCTPVERAYRRDELLALEYLVRGADGVIGVGHRQPGSRFPMIAGFAPGGREVRWHRLVPEGDPGTVYASAPQHVDLVDGTGFVYAGAGHAFARLQAFDPASGAIAWDTAIAGGATAFFTSDWIAVTKTRVYLAHNRYTLEVFDRATGAPLGGLGLGR